MTDLEQARDLVWRRLPRVRRAILGRERCDAIVRTTIEALPSEAFAAAASAAGRDDLRRRTQQLVEQTYQDRAGLAFMSLILWWAISTIVQILVVRWWTKHHEEPQP
jgi:hypothetical protein